MADKVLYKLAKAIWEGKDPPRSFWLLVPSATISGLLVSKNQHLARIAAKHGESPGDYENLVYQTHCTELQPQDQDDGIDVTPHIILHDASITFGDSESNAEVLRINLELVCAWGYFEELQSKSPT